MREAHERERAVGVSYYVSDADGIGGRLRARPGDFRVRELEAVDAEPVDADPGAYPHLLIRATLRDWDTNDFAGALSGALGISRERVDWAGTKDKRAVTTQLFTVRGVEPDRLPDLPGAEIEVVGRTGRNVHFGDLAGNAFEVVVREPERPEGIDAVTADLRAFAGGAEDVDEAEDADADRPRIGVPNYFGQQRFGSVRPVTHEVGLAIARRDWAGAVLAYLGEPDEAEPEDTREARRYVRETRDWKGALDRFPGRLTHERAMLHALVERGAEGGAGDYRAALEAVPTNLQRLFVHAGQSYAFNRILSERLARGLPFHRPVEGDVVCFADRETRLDREARPDTGTRPGRETRRASGGARGRRPRAPPGGLELPDVERTQRVTADRVETVTRHCERGRAFVTAPLVGTDTELAGGEPGEIERRVLDELDLRPSDFDLPGEFDSAGTRRAILVRTGLDVERDPPTFSFALPKGSYATVLLREYLKVDPLEMG